MMMLLSVSDNSATTTDILKTITKIKTQKNSSKHISITHMINYFTA